MKKVLLAIFLIVSVLGFAQESNQDFKKNELKINGLLLIGGSLEVTYERILNEESAIGISGLVSFDDDVDINYYIAPYYRFYFGKKPAAGFFVEGFGMLNSTDDGIVQIFLGDVIDLQEDNITDFALGIGIGGKFITKRNFIAEINLGVGRNIFNSDDRNFEFIGRGGISIGFRF
ncbi:DUF3575 domain-containing protein [Flavobacteriaceae bacterium R38]|nr:DUF3575 domain-containing protein [Flavobacteriaceae bacterium R38]